MAQDLTDDEGGNSPLFNSSLETGVRAVVVLDAAFPRAFDLSQLTWLDHLVVHTADIGGPDSLHPDIPQRTGELLVRGWSKTASPSCAACILSTPTRPTRGLSIPHARRLLLSSSLSGPSMPANYGNAQSGSLDI
jgi:ABC-three component (ABC-3C) system Middle Component 2